MRSERVEFPGSQGFALAGRLDQPDDSPRACALFAHCFTCSKDIAAASRIAKGLVEPGLAVLRFDFTGLGRPGAHFGLPRDDKWKPATGQSVEGSLTLSGRLAVLVRLV